MSRFAFRLLLAFCLVLNGVGSAMAAVAMPAMVGVSAHALMAKADAALQTATACDHTEGDAAQIAASLDQPAPSNQHPADCKLDCCAQGACSCPCMQLAQAALLDMVVSSVPTGLAREVAALHSGYAPPLLLSLIRPPIG